MSILIDFYNTAATPSRRVIAHLFEKHVPSCQDNLARFALSEGKSWWESEYFERFSGDLARVRRIVDNYLDKTIIEWTDLHWINEVLANLIPPSLTPRRVKDEDENNLAPKETPIDLEEYRLVERYGYAVYRLPLHWAYHELMNEIKAVVMGAPKTIKRCFVCGTVFDVPAAGVKEKIFCSQRCKTRDYRQRKSGMSSRVTD